MKMIPVESSNIVAICYDPETQIMHVQFKNGTYRYEDVPAVFFDHLKAAESKGKFLNASGRKGVKI